MLISVGHVSRYTYSTPSRYSIQSLRLTPPSFIGQRVLQWDISAPGIGQATRFRDHFGNISHLLTLTIEHSDIVVIARGVVQTEDRAGVVKGLPDHAPVRVFLRNTASTALSPEIEALVGETDAAANRLDRLHRIMHAVRDSIDYRRGVTTTETTAAAALAAGYGVCQDHAHVFIAAARSIGLPARYVSGYLLSDATAPEEAHHAWAEVHLDGFGWVGFDPANRVCPTDRYVRLATGLDAPSAAPIRGSRRGSSNETLDVLVEVQQQNAQQ